MNHEEYATLKANIPKAMLPCGVCGELINFSKHPVIKTWTASIEISPEEQFKLTNDYVTEMPLCWECYQFLQQFLAQNNKPKEFLRKFFEPIIRNSKFTLPQLEDFSEF